MAEKLSLEVHHMQKKKIVIAAGGSGGHLYPAFGLARQLLGKRKDLDVLFVASGLDENPFFDKKQFSYRTICSGTFKGWSPVSALITCKNIGIGYAQSIKILSEYRPDIVIGFGSYHTFPLLLAAASKFPIVLHEQNSHPGRVIRFFSKKALFTGIYFPTAANKLKGKCIQLAMPLRDGFCKDSYSKEHALSYFELDPAKKTVLVFGGSQGSQAINQMASKALSALQAQKKGFQVLHFTGNMTALEPIIETYRMCGIDAVVKRFEEKMELAWHAADFCIARAGAGSIAEQIEFCIPGILIPYPYAADKHQDCNADFFVDVVGGGWKFVESQFGTEELSCLCSALLAPQSKLLNEKREKLQQYRQLACRREFATFIEELWEK